MSDTQFWPTEIRLGRDRHTLAVTYDDGRSDELEAEYLRVESPSAEVQGHTPDQKQLVSGKKNVAITAVEPIGSYAVKLTFSDGHSTGIYSWSYLRNLADHRERLWEKYLNDLAERGLSR